MRLSIRDSEVYYERYEQCAKCECYYLNHKEGSELRNVMDEAQIECSNERTFVNPNQPCDCFQKKGRRR